MAHSIYDIGDTVSVTFGASDHRYKIHHIYNSLLTNDVYYICSPVSEETEEYCRKERYGMIYSSLSSVHAEKVFGNTSDNLLGKRGLVIYPHEIKELIIE